MENHNISLLNDYYGSLLTKKQQKVIDLFYNKDFSLSEIAEQFSISRQAVLDTVQRGEKALFDFEEKIRLIDRREQILAFAENICEVADSDSEIVNKLARKIIGVWEQ